MEHLFTVDPEHVVTTGDDWYTPRWIFDAAGIEFNMDVAAPMDLEMQHVPARRFLTAVDDGLAAPDWSIRRGALSFAVIVARRNCTERTEGAG